MRPLLIPALALLVASPTVAAGQAMVQSVGGNTDADRLAVQMRLLASNANDLNALISAGELSLKLGDLNAAASLFARAERIQSRNARVKAGMAAILVRSERPGEALRYFALAEQMGIVPRLIAADRGFAYDLIGDQERAQRDYRVALRDAPDDETVRRYALSLGISGQRDKALEQIDTLLRKGDRGAWRVRAFVLAMTGDVAGANRIATTMMPPGTAAGLQPFFERLPSLSAADRAFAVHFGEVRATPERIADARMAPVQPPLGPEPGAPAAVAAPTQQVAAVAPKETKRSRRDRKKDQLAAAQAARAAQAAQPPALPAPPSYAGQPAYAALDPLPPTVRSRSPGSSSVAAANRASLGAAGGSMPPSTGYATQPVQTAAATPTRPPVTTPVQQRAAPTANRSAQTYPPVTSAPPTQTASVAQPVRTYPPVPSPTAVVRSAPTSVAATPQPAPGFTASPTGVSSTTASPAAVSPTAKSPTIAAAPVVAGPPASARSVAPSPSYGPPAAQVAAAPGQPAAAASTPRVVAAPVLAAKDGGDSVLARIIAGLTIPDAELATPSVAPPSTRGRLRPQTPVASHVLAEAQAKTARDAAAEKLLADKEAADASRKALTRKELAARKLAAADETIDPKTGRKLTKKQIAARKLAAADETIDPDTGRKLTKKQIAARKLAATDETIDPDTGRKFTAKQLAAKKRAEADETIDPKTGRKLTAKQLAAKARADADPTVDPVTGRKLTKKQLAAKKVADDKALAETKTAADEKKAARDNPGRIWVQVAGGAQESDLPKAWSSVKAKAPAAFAGKQAWTTPLRATNRVLAGPFKTNAEARAFVNQLTKAGVSSFSFTSDSGQKITRLPTK